MTRNEYQEYLYLKRKNKVCPLDKYELCRLFELENKKG